MSTQPESKDRDAAETARQVPPPGQRHVDGIVNVQGESYSEKLVDAIEMIGEEKAAGLRPHGAQDDITPGMRYLHCSRTIHQLVTDRNRAVGIYLAVASLLLTASGAIFHASPQGDLILPLVEIQKWCLPVTFGTLTVLAVLIAFLLIRTRVGLIYEVAKMNALLGLPIGRVQRIQPLSIFFTLQSIISLGGGCSGALLSIFLIRLADREANAALPATLIGVALALGLMLLYVFTVKHTTSDERLQKLKP